MHTFIKLYGTCHTGRGINWKRSSEALAERGEGLER